MNNEFENIIKVIKNIKLSNEEKSDMRNYILQNSNLSEVNTENTAPKGFINRIYYQITENYNFMFNQNKFVPTLIVAMIVTMTGGASALAERSIPGDFLYNFKIFVNEPAAGVFALTKEEKTEWKERIVERRLDEVQKLVSNNTLDETTRLKLETKIKQHIEDFNINVSELAQEKNESINSSNLNIRLQASLSAYGNVLQRLSLEQNRDENTKQETEKLLASLSDSEGKVKNDHKSLELNVKQDDSKDDGKSQNANPVSQDSNSAFGKQHAAENLLNSIKLNYQKDKINLSANIQSQVDNKLANAEKSLEDGKSLMNTNDYTNALTKFQTVINTVNDAKLLMLSNVIKKDIEDDIGLDDNDGDIEENETEDQQKIEEDGHGNSSEIESTNQNEKHDNSDDEYEQEDD